MTEEENYLRNKKIFILLVLTFTFCHNLRFNSSSYIDCYPINNLLSNIKDFLFELVLSYIIKQKVIKTE